MHTLRPSHCTPRHVLNGNEETGSPNARFKNVHKTILLKKKPFINNRKNKTAVYLHSNEEKHIVHNTDEYDTYNVGQKKPDSIYIKFKTKQNQYVAYKRKDRNRQKRDLYMLVMFYFLMRVGIRWVYSF